jgi:outer membrane protein OmpA-like peptidoglycan-associated protein
MSGRRGWVRWVPLALIATGALALIATLLQSGDIESGLTAHAREALTSAGISSGSVTFDGRDATLRGVPENQAAQAIAAVREVNGVRGVDSTGEALPPAPPVTLVPTPSPSPSPVAAPPPDGGSALQADIDRSLATEPITFEPDSAELTAQGKKTAKAIAGLIRTRAPDARVEIGGHVAKGPGGTDAARELSQRRAEAVQRLVVASGVSRNRVSAKGFGDSRPSPGGDDRRVEITVR